MAIPKGTRLGCYEILSLIGTGGMGEVYRANDTKLRREVAVKVLPDAFAHDPERLARFRREAQLLAALNHPNIAAIYGLEESDGRSFLVLELVPGETLAQRIHATGPLPVEETLVICRQIAEALEAAHEKAIIHRDLKPANIKVTPEGKVKVLDFGLAKAFAGEGVSSDPSESPTLSAAPTLQGTILGTAAYMSPEQARGKTVDKRTDLWAFGCVLYELLTGKQAFRGDDVQEILATVLKAEPDWQALPANTPVKIQDLLRRCLQKDLKRRFRDAADAHIEIEDSLSASASVQPAPVKIPALSFRRWALFSALACVLAAAVTGLAVWTLKPTPPKPVTRTVIALPAGDQWVTGFLPGIALSPDGGQLAYVATRGAVQQIYLRALDSLDARPVSGTEGANAPFFSPDGQWLGFVAGQNLKKVSVSGGAPLTIAALPSSFVTGSWGSNDVIVLVPGPSSNLWQVAAAGGTAQPLTRLEKGESGHYLPEVLPGGKAVVFTVWSQGAFGDAQIVVQSLETGKRKVLVNGGNNPRYASSGHLIYIRSGTLLAAPFDLKRLEVTGPPVPLVEGVLETNGVGQFSISNNGSLVYLPGAAQGGPKTLVWVDRKGTVAALKAPARSYGFPRISPDGQQLAVWIQEYPGDIWIYSLAHDTLTRLTFDGNSLIPAWARDGKRVAFASGKGGLLNFFWKPADGSGAEERLSTSEFLQIPGSFTPDGRAFLFSESAPKTGQDIWVLPLEGDRKPRVFLQTQFNEITPQVSPDGRWVAYNSDESGRYDVYLQPFPGPGGKHQISTEGGREIVWGANGELVYRNGDKMMAVEIKTQPVLEVGKPRVLFEGHYEMNPLGPIPFYDMSADGQRFLMIKPSEQASAATQINVVENWFEELKRRVPVK